MSEDVLKTKKDRIVVVGIHTILGELLVDQLEADPLIREYWAIDLHAPAGSRKYLKMRFHKLNLIEPGADAKLAEKLQALQISVLVHTASKNNPTLNHVYAHELEVIGTLAMVSAAKSAGVRKFIFCSTTAVYGASSKNPNYISENHPLAAHPHAHYIRDKVDAEKQVAMLHHDAPQMIVTVLRFALILGPRSKNYFTELLRRPLVPTLLGYDPLMQFIHEEDAQAALARAVEEDFQGAFNIAGSGVIPLSYALREAKKISIPIVSPLAYSLVQVLWNLQLSSVPGRLLDYFRYLWVADAEKAGRVMNFKPRFSSREAFLDFAKHRRLREYQPATEPPDPAEPKEVSL